MRSRAWGFRAREDKVSFERVGFFARGKVVATRGGGGGGGGGETPKNIPRWGNPLTDKRKTAQAGY